MISSAVIFSAVIFSAVQSALMADHGLVTPGRRKLRCHSELAVLPIVPDRTVRSGWIGTTSGGAPDPLRQRLALTPTLERQQDRLQSTPVGGQGILDLRGNLGIDLPMHQTIAFQLP